MTSKQKERKDRQNVYTIYDALASEREAEFRSLHAGVARLHRRSIDTVDWMQGNPNDRIAWAVESGMFVGQS